MAATEAQKRYWKTPKGKAMKKAADARHYARNREAIVVRVNAAYHALSPAEKLERGRRNRASEGQEKRRENQKIEQARLKIEVLTAYGGRCACCGTDYLPHLTLDHIDGGGRQDRLQYGGDSRPIYRRLRREGYPSGFQVLCWNCNSAKHLLGQCGCQGALLREVG